MLRCEWMLTTTINMNSYHFLIHFNLEFGVTVNNKKEWNIFLPKRPAGMGVHGAVEGKQVNCSLNSKTRLAEGEKVGTL